MSLISDALKLAQETQPKPPVPEKNVKAPQKTFRLKFILAGGLAIAILASILLLQKPQQTPTTKPVVAPVPVAIQKPAEPVVVPVVQEVKPVPPSPVEPPKLTLQGILMDSRSREAMINDISVKEGEDIDGAKVISIERKLVKLQFAGREIVLRIQ